MLLTTALLLACDGVKLDLDTNPDTDVATADTAGGPEDTGLPDEASEPEETGDTSAPSAGDTAPDTAGDTAGDTAADTAGDTAGDTAAPEEPSWLAFEESREEYLVDLGALVLECTQNTDTSYPVFHGCYDWHSAVHGVYALHVLYRLTGEGLYLEVADELLTPEAIAREQFGIQSTALDFEIPYGFAWFLALAREREAATGERDLAALGELVADKLQAWATDLSPVEVGANTRENEYHNLSWALLNLHQWAVWEGDVERAAEVEALSEALLDIDLPLEDDVSNTSGFFPPAHHRARLLAALFPEALDDALPDEPPLTPLTSFSRVHSAGLNFTRAWDLWDLWQATGDARWRDAYREHIEGHMDQPEYWAENYNNYTHWVPQFGVYAIALSYD